MENFNIPPKEAIVTQGASEASVPEQLPYFDYAKISEWMARYLAKRRDVPAVEFVEANIEKVISFFALEDLDITEDNMSKYYAQIMNFIDKTDEQINALAERKAMGENVSCLHKFKVQKRKSNALMALLVVVLFLAVAYRMGAKAFTYFFVFVASVYTIQLARMVDEGRVGYNIDYNAGNRGSSLSHKVQGAVKRSL